MRYDLSLTIHHFAPTVHVYRYLFDRWLSTLLLLSGERRLCNAILLCHQWNLQRVCIHKIMLRPTDKYIYHFLFGNTIPIRWRKHSANDMLCWHTTTLQHTTNDRDSQRYDTLLDFPAPKPIDRGLTNSQRYCISIHLCIPLAIPMHSMAWGQLPLNKIFTTGSRWPETLPRQQTTAEFT